MKLRFKKRGKIMKQIQVLILESNESFAEEVSKILSSRNGVRVCGVTDDGAEGLSLIKSVNPTVVVLSLFLRNLDGFTVMEEARKEQKKPEFIVMGNFSDDKIINRAISLGARYYLMKPVDAEVVAAEGKFTRRAHFQHLHLHRHSAAHQGV